LAEKSIVKKVCLAGDSMVGKTSLIKRFVYDQFDDKYIVTLGAKVSKKELTVADPETGAPQNVRLMIWDIMGLIGYRPELHHAHFKGAKGALIVCDLTRLDTLETLSAWVSALRKVAGEIPIVFLGNKKDLIAQAEFTEHDLEKIGSEYNAPYLLTSAKTGENVLVAFEKLTNLMLETDRKKK
jgi:small GTP-binding protein